MRPHLLQQGFDARATVSGEEAEIDFVSLLDPWRRTSSTVIPASANAAAAFFTTAAISAEGATIPLSV